MKTKNALVKRKKLPGVVLDRLVRLLGKTRSIYSVLYPDAEDRMPYLLVNAENRMVLQQICAQLNRLRKQANRVDSQNPAHKDQPNP